VTPTLLDKYVEYQLPCCRKGTAPQRRGYDKGEPMKAALFTGVGEPMLIADIDLDGPREGEIRVRIVGSGLCGSDLHLVKGEMPLPLPAVLGHEAAGIVTEVGPGVPGLATGDLVVSCYSSFCGECAACQRGRSTHCLRRPKGVPRELGSRLSWQGKPVLQLSDIGGFAQESVMHYRSVVKIPDEVPPAVAALLGCGVLTGAGAAMNRVDIRSGDTVAVVGVGGVGLNIVQGARLRHASKIVAVDLNQGKLDLARKFGATHTVLAGPEAAREVAGITGGGVNYAFEAIGVPAAMESAYDMLGRHGTLVIVGLAKPDALVRFPAARIAFQDTRIVASGIGDAPFQLFIPELARLYLSGDLLVDELISKEIGLDEVDGGFADMESGSVARSVITRF
jgi:S-(hydroxymethyl)glutathione dehydrogenase/alcohol dehydrogenase